MISFTILGKPKALKRHRSTRRGIMYDPSKPEKAAIWRQISKYKPKKPYTNPIYLKLIFYMPRPKSHYRSGKYKYKLKEKYKEATYQYVKPDIDNLVKLIADTIQGKDRMIVDDSQICMLQAEKIYGIPRTEVSIQEIV